MRPLKLSAVALAAGLAIAGCGGADEQAADSSPPVVNPPTSGSPSPAPSPTTPTPSPSPTTPTPSPSPTPTPPPPPPPPPPAAADACESNTTTRRLSQLQYINALSEFVRTMTNDTALAGTVRGVVENTAQLASDLPIDPEFPKHLGLTRLDQSIGQARGTAIYTVAQNLAGSMTSSTARLNTILGQCNAGVDACLNGFIQKAGRLLYRKPLSAAEVTPLRNAAGGNTSAASVRKVLAAMMSSPQLYLMVERAQTQSKTCAPLSGPELASRLALHFWDSIPDQQLNDAADKPASDSGSLLNSTGYAAQVTRMVNDARADASMRSFFRQWFRLDELLVAPLNGSVGTPKFDAFAGSFRPNADTTNNAINEVLDMVSFLGANNGTLQQIFTNKQSFARTDDIATLYKTAKWDGRSTPPTFAEPEREGLFGRIAFVANGATDTTLPIQRSIKILGALACQDLGLPAIDQSPPAGVVLSGLLSTRTITERITEQTGTVCRACHNPQINPWGFALEKFDALGRVRAKEVVRDAAGKELGQLEINTSTTAQLIGVAPRAISSLAEAQKYLLDSGQMESCFARTYVRYTFGRNSTAADKPLIDAITQQAKAGLKLRDLFSQVALRPEFKTVKGAAQ